MSISGPFWICSYGLPLTQLCHRPKYPLKSRLWFFSSPDLIVGCLIDKCAWPLKSRSHSSAPMTLKTRLLWLIKGDPELHVAPKFFKAHSGQRKVVSQKIELWLEKRCCCCWHQTFQSKVRCANGTYLAYSSNQSATEAFSQPPWSCNTQRRIFESIVNIKLGYFNTYNLSAQQHLMSMYGVDLIKYVQCALCMHTCRACGRSQW